ncbi:MAG: beta-galactosidase [Bacteroidota bacterium]
MLQKNHWGVLIVCFFLLICGQYSFAQPGSGTPTRNDHIFPSTDAAKAAISFDARGFLINGKRTFITSASMEYARVPRALWKDRLLRLKRAGFNTIEMYTFWNYHEAKEGQFNFSGDHDLNAYLQLIKSMGMYAIVRVGPYVCGEWNLGGYPIWLKTKQSIRVREDNPAFLAAVDRFFEKLIPIVSQNQIHKGGSVIMVQLENEHRGGWGTIVNNEYFKHLQQKTISLGMQVPYFFSGLHSGNDPSGEHINLDDPGRPNPWFAPEYWGVWFLNYGPQELDSTLYDRRTWKMLAHGGNGYNLYMAHGGSNFNYDNDKDNAASYDYGAMVGQTGDLRPLYYAIKRANWFAKSFESILANSVDDQQNKPAVSDTNIKVTVRKSQMGSVAFLDNQDSVALKFKFDAPDNTGLIASAEIKLQPGEIMPVVQDYQLTPSVKLVWSPTRIYNITLQGNTTTILLSGDAGTKATLYFFIMGDMANTNQKQNFWIPRGPGLITFSADVTANSPMEYSFTAGPKRIRIVVTTDKLASRSWVADAVGQTQLIIGPDYAADLTAKNGKYTLTTERPWIGGTHYPTWIFKPTGNAIKINSKIYPVQHPQQLKLGAWQVKDASAPAALNYDDSKWLSSKDPVQMGTDGDITAYAWYRTKIKVEQAGNYILKFKKAPEGGALFLDGKRVDTAAFFQNENTLSLKAGVTHTLAVFTSHIGRNKLIFKVGVIDTLDMKGLSGPVILQKDSNSGPIPVNNWKMRGGPCNDGGDGCVILLSTTVAGWKDMPAKNANTPHFYRNTLNLPAFKQSNPQWRVNTTSLGSGSVWVNGHNLGRYPEKIKINGMYIPQSWLKPGKNLIVIFEETGILPNKVTIEAEEAAGRDTQTLQF